MKESKQRINVEKVLSLHFGPTLVKENLRFSALLKAVVAWQKLVLRLPVTMNHHNSDSDDSGSSEGSPESPDFTDMVSCFRLIWLYEIYSGSVNHSLYYPLQCTLFGNLQMNASKFSIDKEN